MRLLIVLLLAVHLAVVSRSSDPETGSGDEASSQSGAVSSRTWKDATGRFEVIAKFDCFLPLNKVRLIKEDGSPVDVEVEALSETDKSFLKEMREIDRKESLATKAVARFQQDTEFFIDSVSAYAEEMNEIRSNEKTTSVQMEAASKAESARLSHLLKGKKVCFHLEVLDVKMSDHVGQRAFIAALTPESDEQYLTLHGKEATPTEAITFTYSNSSFQRFLKENKEEINKGDVVRIVATFGEQSRAPQVGVSSSGVRAKATITSVEKLSAEDLKYLPKAQEWFKSLSK